LNTANVFDGTQKKEKTTGIENRNQQQQFIEIIEI
jgi:translation initiation factor 1A